MKLATLLGVLPIVGPVIASAPEFKELYEEGVNLLHGDDDQATAKEALHDLIADNEEGYRRLDQKLADAAKR